MPDENLEVPQEVKESDIDIDYTKLQPGWTERSTDVSSKLPVKFNESYQKAKETEDKGQLEETIKKLHEQNDLADPGRLDRNMELPEDIKGSPKTTELIDPAPYREHQAQKGNPGPFGNVEDLPVIKNLKSEDAAKLSPSDNSTD